MPDESRLLPVYPPPPTDSGAADLASHSRRGFLRLAAAGGLVLALGARGRVLAAGAADLAPNAADFVPNAFLRIAVDGSIVIYSKSPEIGQGIKTAFPMIVAEELDADWSRVRVEQAPIDTKVYGRQTAGGSRSIPTAWDQLRRAGAVARAMLMAAAAQQWEVPLEQCSTATGFVVHLASGRRLGYGELATAAAALPVPEAKSVILKNRADFRLLGTRVGGVDNPQIVAGAPLFGIDQVLPGMLYATYEKCPAIGGRVASANLEAIRAMRGVKAAFVLEGTGKARELMPGIAIVASSTWEALRARRALQVKWDESQAARDSTRAAAEQARELGAGSGAQVLRSSGRIEEAFGGAARTLEAFYTLPFLAHAPLEPQNCSAWFRDGAIELWAPTQAPERAISSVAAVLGIPEAQVTVHQTRVGGGFGRRLMNDYACEAAAIAQRVAAPVKLQWTREDDLHHDFYRVGAFHSLKGALDSAGRLTAWQDHLVSFSEDGKSAVAGGTLAPGEFPADLVANCRLTQTLLPLMTPCGPWRAPGSNATAFAVQGFLHELATAARRDHVAFLLELLGEPRWLEPKTEFALNTGRAAAVIRLAAEKSGWGERLPKGRGRGLAFHFSHAGHFAEVADVSVSNNGRLRLHRVTVAGDAGPIVNLSAAESQCQGAVMDGFSAMLAQEITLEGGRVQQSNFHDYPLLRIGHAPVVDVHFIQSDFAPTGLGEPALPPLAPAVCNAIFAASGRRVRSLPLSKSGLAV